MPVASNAAVIFSFQEVGADVVGTLSGSLNLSGADHNFLGADCMQDAGGLSVVASIGSVDMSGGPCDTYFFDTASLSFGTYMDLEFGYVGDLFWSDPKLGRVAVPSRYVFGDELSGSKTWTNKTFATLGLTPGDYTWSLPYDTITVRIGSISASVPEPGTLALLGLGLVGIGLRRRAAKATS